MGGAYTEQTNRSAACEGESKQFQHCFVDQDIVVRRLECGGPRQSLEIGIAQFQRKRPGFEMAIAKGRTDFFCELEQMCFELRLVRNISRKSFLIADALPLVVRHQVVRTQSVRDFMNPDAVFSENLLNSFPRHGLEISDVEEALFPENFVGFLSDAGDCSDRQRRQKIFFRSVRDVDDAGRFYRLSRDLGYNFVRRERYRAGEMEFRKDDLLKPLDESGEVVVVKNLTPRKVEIHFINRSAFHDGCQFHDTTVQSVGILRVVAKASAHDDEVGTEPQRTSGRHGRSDAKSACFVRCRCNNAATCRCSSDHDGLPYERAILDALDGDIEAIEIEMGNIAFLIRHGGCQNLSA